MTSEATLRVGESRSLLLVENLTRTQIVMYAGASGDFNPLHTDEIYATRVAGHPSVFAHGMLTMGMAARVITDWVGPDRLTRYGGRFVKQVFPGDSLTATATVTAVASTDHACTVEFEVVVVNQTGDAVLTGAASAVVDSNRL